MTPEERYTAETGNGVVHEVEMFSEEYVEWLERKLEEAEEAADRAHFDT